MSRDENLAGRAVKGLRPAISVLVIAAIWQILNSVGVVSVYMLPAPVAIVRVLVEQRVAVLQAAEITALTAAAGVLIGGLVGVVVALLFAVVEFLRRAFYPGVLFLRAVPLIAIIPLLVLWIGAGLGSRITICAVSSFVIVCISALNGMRSVDPDHVSLMHSLGASPAKVVTSVTAFSSLPFILSAVKIAASTALVEALVAELIAGTSGLGNLINVANFGSQIPLLWAAIVAALVLTGLFLAASTALERIASPWAPSAGLAL